MAKSTATPIVVTATVEHGGHAYVVAHDMIQGRLSIRPDADADTDAAAAAVANLKAHGVDLGTEESSDGRTWWRLSPDMPEVDYGSLGKAIFDAVAAERARLTVVTD